MMHIIALPPSLNGKLSWHLIFFYPFVLVMYNLDTGTAVWSMCGACKQIIKAHMLSYAYTHIHAHTIFKL